MRNDVTYIAIIMGLFALAFLLVVACDRIIGPDSIELEDQGGEGPVASHLGAGSAEVAA